MTVGIICEYSPFHNGHLYQINKIKELYPNATIICVMSSNFLERGDVSIINKWDKTTIALSYGVDLVIELPFVFSSQSADIFAKGAIGILNELKIDKLVFGTESDNIEELKKAALAEKDKNFNKLVKYYLDDGNNYPTSLSKAVYDIAHIHINKPNDLLGLSYIKELNNLNSKIEPVSIKRTNNFHSKTLDNDIVSATAIRSALKENKDVRKYLPKMTYEYLLKENHFIDDYFQLLKYKIISEKDLSIYQTVDEGIEFRIKKVINDCNTLEELIDKLKTKRFTYNKIKRMLIHILCSFTKEEAKQLKIDYIRILGFNENGKKYLSSIKKEIKIPLITGYSKINSKNLDIENRVNMIYSSTLSDDKRNELVKRELKEPIKL